MLTKQQLEADVKRLEMAQGKEMVTVPWDIRRLKDVTRMALASLSGGWRPIEQAKKDGTTILVCVEGYAQAFTAAWTYNGFETGWLSERTRGIVYPTHFQPLPSPPQVSQEGEL